MLAGVVALAALGWYVTRTPLLDVDVIEVVGAERTGVEQVVLGSGLLPGDPLVGVDQDRVAKAVEALPWVGAAEVDRGWDGTIAITVTERVPVATAPSADGGRVVVDAEGRVLAVLPAGTETTVEAPLLPIEGILAPAPGEFLDPAAAGALEVATSITPGLRARVANVVVWGAGDLSLTLIPQGGAVIGPPTAIPAKLASLVTVLSQVDQRGLLTVGLRVPDLPTVTRQ